MVSSVDQTGRLAFLFVSKRIDEKKTEKLIETIASLDEAAEYTLASFEDFQRYTSISPDLLIFYVLSSNFDQQNAFFDELERQKKRLPRTPVVIITDIDDLTFYRTCYGEGVRGLIHTDMQIDRVQTVLHLIASGGTFVPKVLLYPKD